MTAIPTASVNDRYQGKIPSGLERVLWKISGKIPVSIVTSKDYAFILSHEVAEMVVDPAANNRNPEVCDGCAGNCDTFWVDCFDNNSNFVGGSQTIPPSFGYSFFINSIIKQNAIDPTSPKFCAKPEIGAQSACVYAPMVQVPPLVERVANTPKIRSKMQGFRRTSWVLALWWIIHTPTVALGFR